MAEIIPINKEGFDLKKQAFVYGEYPWDRIPEGTYQASFHTWSTYRYFDYHLLMVFCIIEPGNYFGTYIPAFFPVRKLKGKPEVKGKFWVKPTGNLIIALRQIMPDLPRRFRLDRTPMTKLFGHVYEIKVVDVTNDQDGNKHAEYNIYSKVDGPNIKLL